MNFHTQTPLAAWPLFEEGGRRDWHHTDFTMTMCLPPTHYLHALIIPPSCVFLCTDLHDMRRDRTGLQDARCRRAINMASHTTGARIFGQLYMVVFVFHFTAFLPSSLGWITCLCYYSASALIHILLTIPLSQPAFFLVLCLPTYYSLCFLPHYLTSYFSTIYFVCYMHFPPPFL